MKNERFEVQKKFVDDAADFVGHSVSAVTTAVAITSEKSIASTVLILSTIPEFFGLNAATGNALIAVASSLISLVLVKLALRERSHSISVPFISVTMRFYPFWLLYIAQLLAGIAWIVYSGHYIDIALIVFSFAGAVSSEKIATLIKQEMIDNLDHEAKMNERKMDMELAYNTQWKVEEAKAQLKIEELTQRTQARIEENNQRSISRIEKMSDTAGRMAPRGGRVDDPAKTMVNEVDQDANNSLGWSTDGPPAAVAFTADNAEEGRQKQSSRAEQRRQEMRTYLQEKPEATTSELVAHFKVSATTIKRDRAAL